MSNVAILDIFLAQRLIGKLYRFDDRATAPMSRFVSDKRFSADTQQATVSLSMLAQHPAQQESLWTDLGSSLFNGRDGRLPAFFRIHCEDFAQVLNVNPQQKYTGASYAAMGSLMMRFPESLGVNAVHELLRLLVINDLMGNYDAHLKNFCLIYPILVGLASHRFAKGARR